MDSTDADVSRGRHSRSPALNPDRTGCYARHHFNMGTAMVPLRDEGALTIGSGSATHNLRKRSLAQRGASRWKIQRGEQLLAWRRHLMLEWHSHGRTASIHCNVTLGASCRGKG